MSDSEETFEGFKDTEESENEPTGTNADSSDDESDEGAGLFDTMAEEAEDDGCEESDAESDTESADCQPFSSFEKFLQLPFELRRRIWEIFCPEMRLRPRVLSFTIAPMSMHFQPSSWDSKVRGWSARDALELEDMTLPLRTVLSVHCDSRNMALAVLPDTLVIDPPEVQIGHIRFNRDVDVVKIDGLSRFPPGDEFHLPGFCDQIKTVAFEHHELERNPAAVSKCIQSLSTVTNVFLCDSSMEIPRKRLSWCISDHVNRFRVMTFEREPGYGEDSETLYCWPDIHNHRDFARFQISREPVTNLPEPAESTLKQQGVEAWPMVEFKFKKQLKRYDSLHELGIEDVFDGSEGSDDSLSAVSLGSSEQDLDEYESEGIDDSEIEEAEGLSDEDDGLSTASGPVEEVEARFSSPETVGDSEDGALPVNRGRKRRIVTDSDDSDSEVAQPSPKKRARTAHIILSDSESDAEPTNATGKPRPRQSRVVLSDSEEYEDEAPTTKLARATRDHHRVDDDESSEIDKQESDSSDDDEGSPKQLSLAERLQLHRQTFRVSSPEESVGDGGSSVNDSEDEDDDEDEGGVRNGFILDAAEEDDEDGEEMGDDYDEY